MNPRIIFPLPHLSPRHKKVHEKKFSFPQPIQITNAPIRPTGNIVMERLWDNVYGGNHAIESTLHEDIDKRLKENHNPIGFIKVAKLRRQVDALLSC